MKRHVPVFNILVKTFATKCLVLLTFVLQFLLGWSNQTEVQLPVFFHFNQWIPNRRTFSSICIGPFSSDVSNNCRFAFYSNTMDCFKCYPSGCHSISNFVNFPAINFEIDSKENFNRLMKINGTLFVDLEVKCTWLKRDQEFIKWYVSWCDHNGWPNDRKLQCPDTPTTKTTIGTTFTSPMTWKTTSSTQRSMTSFSNSTHSSPVTHLTWTTPSSTELPVTSYSNLTLSPPVTHLTWTPLVYRQQNNSITGIGEQSKKKDDTILWISLGAAALVVILTAFIILYFQRAKIAKFLRKSGNPDIVDNAFYYRDMSMKRRENQHAPDIVTYENIIPNLCPEEVIYTELDLSAQHNFNPENAAAGIISTLLEQKRDIKSYVDSVIYAELQKC